MKHTKPPPKPMPKQVQKDHLHMARALTMTTSPGETAMNQRKTCSADRRVADVASFPYR